MVPAALMPSEAYLVSKIVATVGLDDAEGNPGGTDEYFEGTAAKIQQCFFSQGAAARKGAENAVRNSARRA